MTSSENDRRTMHIVIPMGASEAECEQIEDIVGDAAMSALPNRVGWDLFVMSHGGSCGTDAHCPHSAPQ